MQWPPSINYSYWTLVLLLVGLATGCSVKFNEQYYVGVIPPESNTPTQFYRFTLDGYSSFGSETRYAAGWYNASVVNHLFGDVESKEKIGSDQAGKPPASGGIGNIPFIFAKGEIVKQPIEVDHPQIKFRKPQLIKLENISEVQAAQSIITVEVDSNGNYNIKRIEVAGKIELSISSVEISVKRELLQYAEVTGGQRSVLRCTDGLTRIDVIGGTLNIKTSDPKPDGLAWWGSNDQTSAHSPHHHFTWKGGRYDVRNGQIALSPREVRTSRSIATFTEDNNNGKLQLSADHGWHLLLKDATFDLNKARVMFDTPPNDHLELAIFSNKTAIAITKDMLSEKSKAEYEQRIEVIKKLKELKKLKDPINIILTDVMLTDPKSRITLQTDQNPQTVQITNLQAELLEVKSGEFEIASVDVIAQHIVADRTRDDHPKTSHFMRFGPEGAALSGVENERFVIFMHSDPAELVENIKSLVSADETQQLVTSLVTGRETARHQTQIKEADILLKTEYTFAQSLVSQLKEEEGNEPASLEHLRARASQWLNSIGSE